MKLDLNLFKELMCKFRNKNVLYKYTLVLSRKSGARLTSTE